MRPAGRSRLGTAAAAAAVMLAQLGGLARRGAAPVWRPRVAQRDRYRLVPKQSPPA
jgi:hypothetical protein